MRIDFRYVRGGSAPSKSGARADRAHLDFSAGIPAAGAAREKARAHRPSAEAGSALLIVLGFLSFMMISAVSFAVYMRIERQASSNYRHATTARHLLNAGLCRAIDDVDEELRNPYAKFPNWPGRVSVSYDNGGTNSMNARVLSLESLSFIPGIFVNDARRYSVPNDATAGAKWRPISMPANLQPNAAAVDVGRYAFVCVNISDMLDVNVCKASVRDSVTNRVSIGHLFANDNQRKAFDDKVKNVDFRYETLQDFYACMYERRKDSVPATISTPNTDTPFGSPYHSFINYKGESSDAFFFDLASSHILCTDSIVKSEPATGAQPCNIRKTQPVAAGDLAQTRTATAALQGEFQTALANAVSGGLPGSSAQMMATMIADYIDTDSIPKSLNIPSVERVPMISQILVPAFFTPTVIMESVAVQGAVPARNKNIYSLQLMGNPATAQLDVELVWPFKNQKDRTPQPSFKVSVEAYFRVFKTHVAKTAQGFTEPPLAPNYIKVTGTSANFDFWNKDTTDPANCYTHVPVKLTAADVSKLTIKMIDSEDGTTVNGAPTGFTEGQPFSVALLVFVTVLSGTDVVDSVPQFTPYPGIGDPVAEFVGVPKIFFQTDGTLTVQKTMAVNNEPIKYQWTCLEVPDPRFNYKAGNWIKNDAEAGATIVPKINPSTVALLGKDGRDGDIYMSVSDVGVLQSPGELGFIVRPFPLDVRGADVDFRTQDTVDKAQDKDYMFRTIRLYDHGAALPHDKIYENFTANNPDGTVPGARVNPLSDLPQVLIAAVVNTPADYYWAGSKLQPGGGPPEATVRDYVFDKLLGTSSWSAFTNGWVKCVVNAKKTSPLNTVMTSHLSDVYGTESNFGWYSKGDPKTIFNGGFAPATLTDPLYEIDRKMLYSFSLESFSDRQQLFLYVLRAEATVPSFGGSTDSGVKTLSGGRAVALVWRDPYPAEGSVPTDYHQHRILYFKQLDN